MKKLQIFACFLFVCQQIVFPVLFYTLDDYPDWVFWLYQVFSILTLIQLINVSKLGWKEALFVQTNNVLWYVLVALNCFYSWKIGQYVQSQTPEDLIQSNVTLVLTNAIYSFMLVNVNKTKYVIILTAACVRLLYYALQATIAIEGEFPDGGKDYYLLFMATQTALYCLIIDEARKQMRHQKIQKKQQSLLED